MLPDGYPPLELYEEVTQRPLFREMREFAGEFRKANADVAREYSARWSEDPLHRWSRRWEYLYVTERVANRVSGSSARNERMLDAGSGLTFFPHWIAHRFPGMELECPDRDPGVEEASSGLRTPAQEAVSYTTQDLAALDYPDESFSLVSCISVLEHTRNREEIIGEFSRVLEPGGVVVLTFDISLDGRWEIPRSEAARLVDELNEQFEPRDDYQTLLEESGDEAILTTDWARANDPTLLPWRYPHPADMIRRFPNVVEMFKPRFKLLTCFCGTWQKTG